MENKKTILFDLDGTLLPIDMDEFIKKYFRLLSDHFSDLFDPEYFVEAINKATVKMIENEGQNTNKEVFEQRFFDLIEPKQINREEIWDRFYDFYDNVFPRLEEYFQLDDLGFQIVQAAKEKGFNLIIATNPLFPKEAVYTRLRWIDLQPKDFQQITSYEDMHYCKPNINYYREILDKQNYVPQDCVMIGNDLRDDMIAKKINIKTFLVEDFMVKRKNVDVKPDWQGTRKEIIDYIKNIEVK